MRNLIDGYNLLHAIGYHGNLSAPGVLETARVEMLDKLANYLTPEELKNTVVVFDQGHRSKEKPKQYVRHGIRVEFAYDYPDADAMIIDLIRSDNVPKQLLVITSDHRIQRTAKARRADFMDSEHWIALLEARPKSPSESSGGEATNRQTPSKTDGENDYWLGVFSADSVDLASEIIPDEEESFPFDDQQIDADEA